MKLIDDTAFGELTFEAFWSRAYTVEFLGVVKNITLIVQTFDDDDISDNQRKTFVDFEKDKQGILAGVENGILNYYKESFEVNAGSIAGLVDLLKIKIMYTETGGDQEIGFICSASFDPELGVGVLVSNGKVEDVDVQDIVLG